MNKFFVQTLKVFWHMICSKNMYLYIDTILRDEFTIALLDLNRKIIKKKTYKDIQTDCLLEKIKSLLQSKKASVKKLKGVFIKHKPGMAFTSLRIGIIVANMFAYILKIPIFEVSKLDFKETKKVKYTKGIYAKKPNITTPNKK